ncbi:phosphatidylinositol phosphate phosphatase [Coprinopsis marcescibilis]|uniref:phosphoinositide 5-phosphatase n=1 Tax=Coprinopsis marcescibilis TaxID=230819 RepID=A0A5C3L861_COPMA|nr:phosphatidylinositol phosphate phosphatase [Coprinopsis marcescibilis]
MGVLYYLSYLAILAGFAFVTLSLASGLLYVSELIEEHSRVAKTVGQRMIYAVISLHVILYITDSLPFLPTAFSILCHVVYLRNFSPSWPLIELTSISFVASCALVVADHFIWFFYFARLTNEARKLRSYRVVIPEPPGFLEIASFFGFCIWLVPLFLFLSLSANDHAIPMSSIEHSGSPRSFSSQQAQPGSRVSLIRSLFSMLPLKSSPRGQRLTRKDTSEGLIAPRSPVPRAASPLPPNYPPLSPRPSYLSPPKSPMLRGQELELGRPHRALVFRAGEKDSQAVVEFLPKDEIDLRNLVRLSSRDVKGCLGLVCIENDLYIALVTSATEIGNTRPSASVPESVAKIHEVSFYSLTSSVWDEYSATNDGLISPDSIDASFRDTYVPPSGGNPALEHPCLPLSKILSSGSFYYAHDRLWDLSSRLSVRLSRKVRDSSSTHDMAAFDERFVWNEYIIRSLLDFRARLSEADRQDLDDCQFLILAIQGYVGVFTMGLPAPPTNGTPAVATLALISRLGWKRAGTRFNTRGIDDDGNTANFVETETIFSTDQHCVSYVQARGSVPLFWEQQGLQTFGHKIQITRPHASQPAFERHFLQMMEEYGAIHAVNLLGQKENEALLTSTYARNLTTARQGLGDDLGITHFDFHNAVRLGGHDSVIRELRRVESILDHVDRFGFTMCDTDSDDIVTDQKGVFRTNCLDCLDRTNFVQDILSRTTLEEYLQLVRREWLQSNTLWSHHRELWAENGDALSRTYAGTGALNTSYTRSGKRTLAGMISDATKSVSRAYINNFQDKDKQLAIDTFLGNLSNQRQVTIFDPVHDSIRDVLDQRLSEYSTTKQCTFFIGTWNVNGRHPSESLNDWLFPPQSSSTEPDMYVLGFQEIVPLTAQQILQTDPEKRLVWEKKLFETLDRRPNKRSNYVLLRSEQLVGTALIILVKAELTAVIRNVEATTRKTGLRGMSGNKGAVGIRLEYYDTSFCFLTAHLAAGYLNTEERNADYRTITDNLHFLKGKTIQSHENVIWLADTNYRIELHNYSVRNLVESDDFDALLAADQLMHAMDNKQAFVGYEEGPILFRPTYRYDFGTDIYDTSEKMRIPAWTDRILYRGNQLDLALYSRAELKGSDHKPVFAIFRAEVRIIDPVKKAVLSQVLLESVASTQPGETLDEKLRKAVLPKLVGDVPPPSSNDSAWWDQPKQPGGIIPLSEFPKLDSFNNRNPFDSPDGSPISASPTTSDEELYSHALSLPTPMIPTQPGRQARQGTNQTSDLVQNGHVS